MNAVRVNSGAIDTPAGTARALFPATDFSNPGAGPAASGGNVRGGHARGSSAAPTPSLDSTVFDPDSGGLSEQDKLGFRFRV
jgi:hypothetical protein